MEERANKPAVLDKHAQLRLLDAVEAEPDSTQADLAAQVGVAVGTVNWYLKRFAADGYVHITRIGRWRWRYILTPHGMTEKARLAASFIDRSMQLYRHARETAQAQLHEVRRAGFDTVRLTGQTDLVDICRLTCLEHGVKVGEADSLPMLRAEASGIELEWPGGGRPLGLGG